MAYNRKSKKFIDEQNKHEDYRIFEQVRDDMQYHIDTYTGNAKGSIDRYKRVRRAAEEVMTEIEQL